MRPSERDIFVPKWVAGAPRAETIGCVLGMEASVDESHQISSEARRRRRSIEELSTATDRVKAGQSKAASRTAQTP
ncbi:hypothetical protein ACFX2C_031771 [Malus domestica]